MLDWLKKKKKKKKKFNAQVIYLHSEQKNRTLFIMYVLLGEVGKKKSEDLDLAALKLLVRCCYSH